jgi:hypothetical protein
VRPTYWILEGRKPVPLEGDHKAHVLAWAAWFEDPKKRVLAHTPVTPKVDVSTVFLGLDHYFGPDFESAQPVLFETMIFGGPWSDQSYQERYRTWHQALAGHVRAVRLAERSLWQRLMKGKPKLARMRAREESGLGFDLGDLRRGRTGLWLPAPVIPPGIHIAL